MSHNRAAGRAARQFDGRRSVGRMYCVLCAASGTGVLGVQAGEDGVTAMQRHLVASHPLELRLLIDRLVVAYKAGSEVTVGIRVEQPPNGSGLHI